MYSTYMLILFRIVIIVHVCTCMYVSIIVHVVFYTCTMYVFDACVGTYSSGQ